MGQLFCLVQLINYFFLLEETFFLDLLLVEFSIDFSPAFNEEPELLEKVLLLDLALGSTLELRPDLTEEVVFRLSFEEIIVVLNIN